MHFFGGLFRGLVITLLGTAAVYVAFFAIMSPKLPKDAAGAKQFLSDLVNVKATISRLQNKSVDYLETSEMHQVLDADIPANAVIVDADAPEAKEATTVTLEEFNELKREVSELRKQLERIEKQNTVTN